MADYNIVEKPVFSETMTKLEPTSKAHADLFNEMFQALLNNDRFTKEQVEELKKVVSDGKTLVANAITRKRINTAADATFKQMADNIDLIKLGWGTATVDQVLEGVTFSNVDGVELTGAMKKQEPYTDATSIATSPDLLYVRIPFGGYVMDTGVGNPEIKVSMDDLRSALGVSADKILDNQSIAYVQGTIPVHAYNPTAIEFIWNINNRIQIAVPRGFYECNWNNGSYEYLTYEQVAAAIGLSADKIKKGENILGITGTSSALVIDNTKKTIINNTIYPQWDSELVGFFRDCNDIYHYDYTLLKILMTKENRTIYSGDIIVAANELNDKNYQNEINCEYVVKESSGKSYILKFSLLFQLSKEKKTLDMPFVAIGEEYPDYSFDLNIQRILGYNIN